MPGPYADKRLYVDTTNDFSRQADKWKDSDPEGAALMRALARVPNADWVGSSGGNPQAVVSGLLEKSGEALRVLVAYNIPKRDLGSHSAGGAEGDEAYLSWVRSIARGLAGRLAIVILEPDALAMSDKMTSEDRGRRISLLAQAVDLLTEAGGRVYIDCGSSNWIRPPRISELLLRAGVQRAAGFALNTSGTQFLEDEIRYGAEIRKVVGSAAGFVIDTSRSGRGPYRKCPADHENAHWCNSPGRGVGARPTLRPTAAMVKCGVHALLWVKEPGSSDGVCNPGEPKAGAFWPERAREQARAAVPFLVWPT
jgi:endoglucanase